MADWLLVDGSSLIFRSFYGVPATIKAPDGRPINAVRGFLDMLARLITEHRPAHFAVASDEDWRPKWRVELIPTYKAHRVAEPVPPLLAPQMAVIHDFLDAFGIDFVGCRDYEAEDVIATWAEQIEGTLEIVSGDRDLFGLIRDPDRRVLYPEKGGMATVDEAEVTRRYGISGRLYPAFAVLRGDPSDGLPGVAGVGPKKAADLIKKYGDVPGLVASGRFGERDRAYLERAWRVVKPVTDAPVQLPPGRRDEYPEHPERVVELSEKYGLQSSCERLLKALRL